MTKKRKIITHLIPFFIVLILLQILWQWNYILLALVSIIMISHILFGKDRRLEFKIMVYGIIWGTALEIFTTNFSHFHIFPNPDFLGIPSWLPILWGYGFVMAKRITSIIYTNSPWHYKHE